MSIILFTGAKGGTGKTLLASLATAYLHRYERKIVTLVGVDVQKIFTYAAAREKLSCAIIETQYASLHGILPGIIPSGGITIIDANWQSNRDFVYLATLVTRIVIPFEYNELDFYKLMFVTNILQQHGVANDKIYLLPNKDCATKNAHIRKQVQKHFNNYQLSPAIPPIPSHRLFSLHNKNINLVRFQLSYILHNI